MSEPTPPGVLGTRWCLAAADPSNRGAPRTIHSITCPLPQERPVVLWATAAGWTARQVHTHIALSRGHAVACPLCMSSAYDTYLDGADPYGRPAVPLLCLDLDGTVRRGPDDPDGRFVNHPDDVDVFDEAVEMMRRWRGRGGRIVGISNQGGIAMGRMTPEVCRAAMDRTNELAGGLFDRIYYCPHFWTSSRLDLDAVRCWCRKPSPGLVVQAMLELGAQHGETYPNGLALFVGDRPEDGACASAAGIPFQWAADWRASAAPDRSAT